MQDRLKGLRERTSGYTVTPHQYLVTAYAALGALTLIVLSGAAVRLTGSGLGCPDWPRCYGKPYPPLNTHALIEFSNRVVTVPVSLAAGLAWLLALRRRPYRRDLAWLGGMLPLGVVGQAVLGGFTVRGALDYGWVMGHFALSMLILLAAVVLAWRAGHEPVAEPPATVAEPPATVAVNGSAPAASGNGAARVGTGGRSRGARPAGDRTVVLALRGLAAWGALTIFAGTAATAAGPHAGGSPGQKINRLDFDGHGTMDFVIHRHAEIAAVFGIAAVAVWWLARSRGASRIVHDALTVLCVLLATQGVVGLVQYETKLPTELVWLHVTLACGAWIAVLWAVCAAERAAPSPVAEPSEQRFEGSIGALAP
jgi:heme a synthase